MHFLLQLHVHESNKESTMCGFMKTIPTSPPPDGDYGVYALDCEMVSWICRKTSFCAVQFLWHMKFMYLFIFYNKVKKHIQYINSLKFYWFWMLVKVQSHYSVCIAYANFRKLMQISENVLYAQLLIPPLDYRHFQLYK